MSGHDEFPAPSRRSFLKLAGFTFLTGCSRGLEHKAIPFLVKPEEITPGRAAWYATLCGGCPAGCGVLAKSRDGRPIKLEGNPRHPLSGGGLCAVGQADLLGLYDSLRLSRPLAASSPSTWESVDEAIRSRLEGIEGGVRFLTGTVHSPTLEREIDRFLARFPDGRHVMYDVLTASALREAHDGVCPRFHFDRADVIVAFDADFLGTWISPVEFTRAYRAGRTLDGEKSRFSRHVQLEARMSLTGSNADRRITLAPEQVGPALAQLAEALAQEAGRGVPWGETPASGVDEAIFAELAELLRAAPRGRTLVVCGSNDVAHQRLASFVNDLLGNYGATVDLKRPSRQRLGSDADLEALRQEIADGQVGALFVAGCNPQYDLPAGLALDRVGMVVSFAEREDETAAHAHFVCPDHHFLESWGDGEPVAGLVTVSQPLVRPLGKTRALVESLARWRGDKRTARDLVRDVWREDLFKRQQRFSTFERFWTEAVHDGHAEIAAQEASGFRPRGPRAVAAPSQPAEGELSLVLYGKVGMLDGRHAHNAWLQELPDPVSKIAWDNYASLSPAAARKLGVSDGDIVRVGDVELPAFLQPGQHDGTVAVAIGYGRRGTDRFEAVAPKWIEGRPTVEPGGTIGVNAAPLQNQTFASVSRTGRRHELACSQPHHSLEGRAIAQETTLDAYMKDPAAGGHPAHEVKEFWPRDHVYTGHHWGLAIDLTACTGCSACVLGCQAENNIPVVGRDEVRRQREMHWLRIDRYYQDNGEVVFQPMLCQHCDNAPCESVCPVLATVHSSEGLNQQIYNRCVGTRYCANNCPYKVRRFNWFDYPREDKLANMVLNPDVTVRMRGVMEKCSFCVQRIQEAKAEAKREGRAVNDGDIQPACVQSCPAQAMVFGDMNDEKSAVSKAKRSGRHFRVLEQLDVRPSVGYLRLVRNREEKRHG